MQAGLVVHMQLNQVCDQASLKTAYTVTETS